MSRIDPEDREAEALWKRIRGRDRARRTGPCPSAIEIASYLDRKSSAAQAAIIEDHFLECSTCLRTALDHQLGTPRRERVPRAFLRRLSKRISEEAASDSPSSTSVFYRPRFSAPGLGSTLQWGTLAALAITVCWAGFRTGEAVGKRERAAAEALSAQCTLGLEQPSMLDMVTGEEHARTGGRQ